MTGPLGRLRPRSYRARSALGILVAVVLTGLVALVLTGVIRDRARAQVESTLALQADAVAATLVRNGPGQAAATSAAAARLLPDTRVLVRIGGIDLYWSRPAGDVYARASAQNEWATVTLERVDPVSAVSAWAVLGLVAVGVGAAAGIAWLVSGSIARSLRGQLRELSEAADRVAQGHLDARAPEPPDEIGHLAERFNAMAARLEAADARQREFLADAAHELRTPVTAIEGFAAALEDGTARSDEDRQEAAGFIRQEAARLRVLVRDLQELTWLDLDPPLNPERTDLAELGREAVARFAADAQARGVELSGPSSPVPVVTDPAHVATILGNLISNALRATPRGGRVEVRAGSDGGDAYLAVADTGVGIREEHLPFLFDRLFRVEACRRRDDDAGSGLGLSIVKRLALVLGGRVTVESTPGEGSTFTVWLMGARTSPREGVAGRAAA